MCVRPVCLWDIPEQESWEATLTVYRFSCDRTSYITNPYLCRVWKGTFSSLRTEAYAVLQVADVQACSAALCILHCLRPLWQQSPLSWQKMPTFHHWKNVQELMVKEGFTFPEARKQFLESKWNTYKGLYSSIFCCPAGVDIATQTTFTSPIWIPCLIRHSSPGLFATLTDVATQIDATASSPVRGIEIWP